MEETLAIMASLCM